MSEFIHAKVEIGETAATIAADGRYIDAAVGAIKSARSAIERQIRRDPFFLTTLEPYDRAPEAHGVVARMCEASKAAGVGPMAAVAGVIAEDALDAMVDEGCAHGWVENGGDIAMLLDRPATMEIFSQPGARSAYAFELGPMDEPLGVCSSSGRLGHSISFGDADIAVAVARSATLADALATAIGNRVTDQETLGTCFEPFAQVPGFTGGLAMRDGAVAMHGKLPRLVEVEHNASRITVHSRMAADGYTGTVQGQGVKP
jgi:hypothetical protein